MIELPYETKFSAASVSVVDFGGVLRPATGARLQRVDRPGARFAAAMSIPISTTAEARALVADLVAAKFQGVRIYYPLQYESQGYPGNPVVDGSGQSGKTLRIRNLTANYGAKKGYFLSVVDPSGQHYFHQIGAKFIAGSDGRATFPIETALRYPFPDGCSVRLARPMIEGLIGDDISWTLALGGLVDTINFTIEEAA